MAGKMLVFFRNFTTTKPLESMAIGAANDIYLKDALKWKKLFYFVCCPAIVIELLNVYLEEPPKRPEFKKYSHLRIRNKPFPWRDGVKTLFHNPHLNALPDGYEAEEHH